MCSRVLLVLVWASVLGCGATEPPPAQILGQWTETAESRRAKFTTAAPSQHTVELFPDGTGVSLLRLPEGELTTRFTWSLSADRERIKTEGEGRVYVQRLVTLTRDTLETDGPGYLAGRYRRAP